MSFQKWKKKKENALDEGKLDQVFAACLELAEHYTHKEEFENALQEYKEAKRAAKASNDTINVALCHRMVGQVYCSMQNYDLAVKYQLKYLELARSTNDPVEEQRALANLGHMYFLKGETYANPESQEKNENLAKAKKYCSMSLQVCERLSHISKKELADMQARLHLNLGLILEQQCDKEVAVGHLHRAINLCKNMDIWDILFRSYNALASLYQHESKNEKALEFLDKALSVAQRLPEKKQFTCDILLQKADILFVLPDFRGAKQCLLKAYKINSENRDEVEKRLRTAAAVNLFEEKLLNTPDYDLAAVKSLYESLGDGCVNMKSYSKALEYYHLMLETAVKMGESGEKLRPCYVSLSQTYKDIKKYDLALKYLNLELELNINNPVESCKTTLNIAEILELKEADVDEIVSLHNQARVFAQEADDHKLEIRVLSSLRQVLTDRNKLSEARKLENELEDLKEKFGPLSSSSESEDENTPDIGADINLDELSDVDQDNENNACRTRRKCPTKFRKNEKGEFPLHTAAISGNLTLVQKLLDQGHPVNVRDHNGWLPLHEACNHGYVDIVNELIDHKAWINDKGTDGCDGVTPLLDAACNGHLDVIQLLLQRGASPVMRTNKGETVLECLTAWRKRYVKDEKRDLDPDTLAQYNSLIKTLRLALTKAGHKPDTERKAKSRSPSPVLSPQPSTSRHHSTNQFRDERPTKQKTSLRRSIDDQEYSRNGLSERDPLPRTSSTLLRRSSDLRGSTDDMFSQESSYATREYEDAMKALRRKPTLPKSQSPPPTNGRNALVEEEEFDWLEDDLAVNCNRGMKRRRTHQFEGEPARRMNRLLSPTRSEDDIVVVRRNTLRPISPVTDFGSAEQGMDVDVQNEALTELTDLLNAERQNIQEDSIQTRNPPPPPRLALSTKPSYQVPLSVFGVVRHPAPQQQEPPVTAAYQPNTTQAFQTMPQSQMMSSMSFAQPSQLPPPNAQMAPPSIKIRVEGKLLLIPLPTTNLESLTIGWLAEEAAKRYYSFEGVEPRLTMTTEEGAMLSSHDPVTLLLSYREVVGVVTSWKTHPVTERYKEVCSQLGVEPDEYLEQCLEMSQVSLSLNLADSVLNPERIEPVLRAVNHQTNLQHLILSDNRLGDSGVQMLAKFIVKLSHLRELDLTCNGMTAEGFNFLVQQITEYQACKRLEILRLSHNLLGKSCLNLLSRLLFATSSLTNLSLVSVGLTQSSFSAHNRLHLDRVDKLDVSHNKIGVDGSRALLRELSVSHVTSLGLSYTGHGAVQAVTDWLNSGVPCRLRTLNLANCTDESQAFTSLIRSLERCACLEHLELTYPQDMSGRTLETLYKLKLRVLRLPGTKVLDFPPVIPPIEELSCLSLNPPSWAFSGPFGLVTTSTGSSD